MDHRQKHIITHALSDKNALTRTGKNYAKTLVWTKTFRDVFGQNYRVALNLCREINFADGRFLCFVGTNFCDWEKLDFSCWGFSNFCDFQRVVFNSFSSPELHVFVLNNVTCSSGGGGGVENAIFSWREIVRCFRATRVFLGGKSHDHRRF